MGLEHPGIQHDERPGWWSLGILSTRWSSDHATNPASASPTEDAQWHHESTVQERRLFGGEPAVPRKLRCACTGPSLAQHTSLWLFWLESDLIMCIFTYRFLHSSWEIPSL